MTRFRQYEMTAAQWASQNPVLLKGEVGWESGTPAKAKKGDGVTAWNSLPYAILPPVDTSVLATLASPVFTGDPRVPTAATSDNDTTIANTAFVKAAIAALIAGSPALLDTLDELAAALGDDPNFAATMATALAAKAPLASPTFTGDPKAPTAATTDNDTSLATTAFVKNVLAVNSIIGSRYKTADLALTASTTVWTAIALDGAVSLDGLTWDAPNNRYGVTTPGRYTLTVGVVVLGPANGTSLVRLLRNGSEVLGRTVQTASVAAFSTHAFSVSAKLAANDTIAIQVQGQSSGFTLVGGTDRNTRLEICYAGS